MFKFVAMSDDQVRFLSPLTFLPSSPQTGCSSPEQEKLQKLFPCFGLPPCLPAGLACLLAEK